MRETQNSLPDSRAEPSPLDTSMKNTSGRVARADGNPCDEFGGYENGDLGAHRLLSRPTVPEGRRSLFRR